MRVKLADVDIYATFNGSTQHIRSRRDLARFANEADVFVQVVPRNAPQPPRPVLVPFGQDADLPPELVTLTGIVSVRFTDDAGTLVPWLKLATPSEKGDALALGFVHQRDHAARAPHRHTPRVFVAASASTTKGAVILQDQEYAEFIAAAKARSVEVATRMAHVQNGVQGSISWALAAADIAATGGTTHAAFRIARWFNKAQTLTKGISDAVVESPREAEDEAKDLGIDAVLSALGPIGLATELGRAVFSTSYSFLSAAMTSPPPVELGPTLESFVARQEAKARRTAHIEASFDDAMENADGWVAARTTQATLLEGAPTHVLLNPQLLDPSGVIATIKELAMANIDEQNGFSAREADVFIREYITRWQDANPQQRCELQQREFIMDRIAVRRSHDLREAGGMWQLRPARSARRKAKRARRPYQQL